MIENFFNPRSVAVVGASHKPGKIGYVILENFVKNGYTGKIFPVNPDTTPIFNLEVYPSLEKIPHTVELAVIAVPATAVAKILKECIEKKVKTVIIVSSGFSETGEGGKKLEEQLKKIISNKKIRVIGPNCLGVFDSETKVDTLFLSADRLARPKAGGIAFVSQSGAVGSTIMDWLAEEKIGISKFVSYGNAVDVNELDLMKYLADDSKTKVIAAYLEGIKSDGKNFVAAMKKIARRKPVVILKAGKTEKGTEAVSSHTGSLAGSAKVYSAVFKQTGIVEAKNWEELFDFCKAFSMQPLPTGKKLFIITNGGGFGVLATDEAVRQNLQLKELSERMKIILKRILPDYANLANPLDVLGDATADRYKAAIEEAVKEFDGVVCVSLFQVPTLEENLIGFLADLQKSGKPILCCASGGGYTKRIAERLEARGLPVYDSPERAVRAFAAVANYSEMLKRV